jgi:hypothetical protein
MGQECDWYMRQWLSWSRVPFATFPSDAEIPSCAMGLHCKKGAAMRSAALSAVLLAGCAHHPLDCAVGFYHEDCLPGTRAYEEQRQRAGDNATQDDATCKSYGLIYGTQQYASCRMDLANQRAANARAATAAAVAAMQATSAAAPAPVYIPPATQEAPASPPMYVPPRTQAPVSQINTHGPLASLARFHVSTSVTGKMAWVCEYIFGGQPFEVTLDHQCPPTIEVQ